MQRLAASACAILLATSAAMAASPSPLDDRFVTMASVSNTFEIQEARLALQRSSDPQVRAFARWMITDHTMAQHKLDRAAARIDAESGPMLDATHEAMVAALEQRAGAEFEAAYMADQVAAHAETMAMLQDYQATGEDPALRTWVDGTLPKVSMHFSHAQMMSTATPAS